MNESGFEMVGDCGPLFGALAKAQGEFGPVLKSKTNPHFKSSYADLADVIEATRKALVANGLCCIQPASRNGDDWTVTTVLAHSSGALLRAVATIPQASDWQKLGSAVTYCRRYQLSAILGVASEDDDDGNQASTGPSPAQQRYEQKKTQATPPQMSKQDVLKDEPKRQPTMPPPPPGDVPAYAPPEDLTLAAPSTKQLLGSTARQERLTIDSLNNISRRAFGVPVTELQYEVEFQKLIKLVAGGVS